MRNMLVDNTQWSTLGLGRNVLSWHVLSVIHIGVGVQLVRRRTQQLLAVWDKKHADWQYSLQSTKVLGVCLGQEACWLTTLFNLHRVGGMSGTRSMAIDYSLQSTQCWGVHHSGMRNVVVARIHSGVGGLGRETWYVCQCTRIHQCCFSVNRADQIR